MAATNWSAPVFVRQCIVVTEKELPMVCCLYVYACVCVCVCDVCVFVNVWVGMVHV